MLSAQHKELAEQLATRIDNASGGHPLISIHSHRGRQLVLWQYGKLDLTIEVSTEHPDFHFEPEASDEGFLYYYATSLETAMDFVKAVECIRQRATFPYLRLGPAFGLPSNTELLFHNV